MADGVVEANEQPRPHRGLSLRSRFDLVFDLILFLAFGVAYSLNFTGEEWHEWFGLAFGLALLVHLTLHWDWVVRTARRILTTTGRRRFTLAVNLLLCFDLVLCVGSGILISRYAMPSLGLNIFATNENWTDIHEKTADVAIGLIALHVALDWRWITNATKRMFHLGRPPNRGPIDVEE
jgi:cytochrome b561